METGPFCSPEREGKQADKNRIRIQAELVKRPGGFFRRA